MGRASAVAGARVRRWPILELAMSAGRGLALGAAMTGGIARDAVIPVA